MSCKEARELQGGAGHRRIGLRCWAPPYNSLYIQLYNLMYSNLYSWMYNGLFNRMYSGLYSGLYRGLYTCRYLRLSARAQRLWLVAMVDYAGQPPRAPMVAAITETTMFPAKPMRTRPSRRSIHFLDRAKRRLKARVESAAARSTNQPPTASTTSRP